MFRFASSFFFFFFFFYNYMGHVRSAGGYYLIFFPFLCYFLMRSKHDFTLFFWPSLLSLFFLGPHSPFFYELPEQSMILRS